LLTLLTYAQALENSGTAVGVRCKDGIVFGVEKLLGSKMLVAGSGRRVHAIDEHVGAATAGLMPDARQLVSRARDECKAYRTNFGGVVPPRVLSDRLGSFMHLVTVYGYLRPIGAAMLVGGYDPEAKTHELYCVEPNGMAVRYFGYAIGERGAGRRRPRWRLALPACAPRARDTSPAAPRPPRPTACCGRVVGPGSAAATAFRALQQHHDAPPSPRAARPCRQGPARSQDGD